MVLVRESLYRLWHQQPCGFFWPARSRYPRSEAFSSWRGPGYAGCWRNCGSECLFPQGLLCGAFCLPPNYLRSEQDGVIKKEHALPRKPNTSIGWNKNLIKNHHPKMFFFLNLSIPFFFFWVTFLEGTIQRVYVRFSFLPRLMSEALASGVEGSYGPRL